MKWQYSALLENYFQTPASENTVTFSHVGLTIFTTVIVNDCCNTFLSCEFDWYFSYWVLVAHSLLKSLLVLTAAYVRLNLKSDIMWRFVILFTNDSVNLYSNIEVGNPQYIGQIVLNVSVVWKIT